MHPERAGCECGRERGSEERERGSGRGSEGARHGREERERERGSEERERGSESAGARHAPHSQSLECTRAGPREICPGLAFSTGHRHFFGVSGAIISAKPYRAPFYRTLFGVFTNAALSQFRLDSPTLRGSVGSPNARNSAPGSQKPWLAVMELLPGSRSCRNLPTRPQAIEKQLFRYLEQLSKAGKHLAVELATDSMNLTVFRSSQDCFEELP